MSLNSSNKAPVYLPAGRQGRIIRNVIPSPFGSAQDKLHEVKSSLPAGRQGILCVYNYPVK